MKIILIIIIIQFTVLTQTEIGSIKGRVVDADSTFNLAGVTVFISNTDIGSVTDSNGYYEIKGIPLGKYVISCYFFAYATQRDTIDLNKNNYTLEKDFSLKVLKIPISMPDSLKDYHRVFESYKPNEILTIFIDSVDQDNKYLYLTFVNKTKYSIYLIEDLPCFNTISVIVKNVNREVIKRNVTNGCDLPGLNDLPQKNNFLKLKPFSALSLPPTKIHEFYFNHPLLPKGKYYVSVKYEIADYKYLPGIYSNPDYDYYENLKDEIEVLNKATRGIFYSINEIEIEI